MNHLDCVVKVFTRFVREGFFVYGNLGRHAHALKVMTRKKLHIYRRPTM